MKINQYPMKKSYNLLFIIVYFISFFVSFSDGEEPPNPPGTGGDTGNNTFDPEKVDKTFKINNEEHKFSDILKKAGEKYKTDLSKLTEAEATTIVNDFVFVANKQVANELFNQGQEKLKATQTELDNKIAALDIQKKEYDDKLKDAANLIEQIQRDSTQKINDIEDKLKNDKTLTTDQIIDLKLKKAEIETDLKNAKGRHDADKHFTQFQEKEIQRQQSELIISKQLNEIFTKYPNAKPTEDFKTLYNKINDPVLKNTVSEQDRVKFYMLYDTLSDFTKSQLPGVDIFGLKYADKVSTNNGGSTGGNNGNSAGTEINTEVSTTLDALIKSGKLNMNLNDALEALKGKMVPTTPGGGDAGNKGSEVKQSREEKLAAAKF
jgi:hypothetical protein